MPVRRKYRTEFALCAQCDYFITVVPADLGKPVIAQIDSRYPFHIYAICRRPRVRFIAESIRIDDGEVLGELDVRFPTGAVREPFAFRPALLKAGSSIPEVLQPGRVDIENDGATFALYSETGEMIKSGRAWNMLVDKYRGTNHYHKAQDLEVLYVGKAYGSDGERTAPKRLPEHSTLQKILAEAMYWPDHEIVLLLLSYQYELVTIIDGRASDVATTAEEDDAHTEAIYRAAFEDDDRMPTAHLVQYVEAGLIRYFRPPYNEMFRDSFPNETHTSYSSLYDLDILTVNVAMNTDGEGVAFRTWSAEVAPASVHSRAYDLHDPAVRTGLFDIPLDWVDEDPGLAGSGSSG